MSARERLERVCGPQTPPELIAELDAYRVENLDEGIHGVRVWADGANSVLAPGLNFAVGVLMSVRDRTEPGQVDATHLVAEEYPGELDMLRGLMATTRVVADHGDLDDVRKLLDEHSADDAAARAQAKGGEAL